MPSAQTSKQALHSISSKRLREKNPPARHGAYTSVAHTVEHHSTMVQQSAG